MPSVSLYLRPGFLFGPGFRFEMAGWNAKNHRPADQVATLISLNRMARPVGLAQG
jgi:hypothetical protein